MEVGAAKASLGKLFAQPPNNALHATGLALRARPSLASLGARDRLESKEVSR